MKNVLALLLCVIVSTHQCVSLHIHGYFEGESSEAVLTVNYHPRHSRSVFMSDDPIDSKIDVNIRSVKHNIDLQLKSNHEINLNAPVFTNVNNKIKKLKSDIKNVLAAFQDEKNGAAFVVEFNKNGSIALDLIGCININGDEFVLHRKIKDDSDNPFTKSLRKEENLVINVTDTIFQLTKSKHIENILNDYVSNDKASYYFKEGSVDVAGSKKMVKQLPSLPNYRQKRAVTQYSIELFVVTDYSVFKFWYDKSLAADKTMDARNRIQQFYAFVINAIDIRYRSILSSLISVRVVFAGYYIAQTSADSPWTEENKVVSGSNTKVDANTCLDDLKAWFSTATGTPNRDHTMMFTKYDFTTTTRGDSVAGLAFLAGMCGSSSYSVVEDLFSTAMVTIAAHELGHSLGAEHDGEAGNACSAADSFIMTASSSPQSGTTATNPWKFSSCSVTYFETFFSTGAGTCLTSVSASHNFTALSEYAKQTPGQLYSVDVQCQNKFGADSKFCRWFFNETEYSNNFCNKFYCVDPSGSSSTQCQTSVPAYGTSCGNRRWCFGGQCVNNCSAPLLPGDCPFGDDPGIISNGHNCTSILALSKYNCDSDFWRNSCCASCKSAYTGVVGCEYGDKASGCNKNNCDIYDANSRALCCQTCAKDSTKEFTTASKDPCDFTTTTQLMTTTQPTATTNQPSTTKTIHATTAKANNSSSSNLTSSIQPPDPQNIGALYLGAGLGVVVIFALAVIIIIIRRIRKRKTSNETATVTVSAISPPDISCPQFMKVEADRSGYTKYQKEQGLEHGYENLVFNNLDQLEALGRKRPT